MTLTAQDMIQKGQDTNYYVINTVNSKDNNGVATGGVYSTTEKELNIAIVGLNGAEETDTVACQISVAVSLSGNMVGYLESGDAFITLSADNDYEGFEGVSSIDLKDSKFTYQGADNDSKTASATFTGLGNLSLTMDKNTTNVNAKIWIVNKNDKSQNYLAGKTLNIALETTVSGCETTSTPGA